MKNNNNKYNGRYDEYRKNWRQENKESLKMKQKERFKKYEGVYIYKIVNDNDETIYYGSTKNLYSRISAHSTKNSNLKNVDLSYCKYYFQDLSESFNLDERLQIEQYLINKNKTIYNNITANSVLVSDITIDRYINEELQWKEYNRYNYKVS